jgi:serine/threonine-protein kinase
VEGIIKGKLPYLSPEQISQLPIDRRSDIYMLGTTLWEMTTMRRLFKRDDDVETLMLVRAGLVPDPRARQANYPDALWNIVRRALARDRDDRYATAEELARDLDRFVDASGGAEEMPLLTGAVLDALFAGEREARSDWLRRASAPPPAGARATMPPPVPVVGATTGSMAPPAPRKR